MRARVSQKLVLLLGSDVAGDRSIKTDAVKAVATRGSCDLSSSPALKGSKLTGVTGI
jgi:hypothetical protein